MCQVLVLEELAMVLKHFGAFVAFVRKLWYILERFTVGKTGSFSNEIGSHGRLSLREVIDVLTSGFLATASERESTLNMLNEVRS